VRQCISEYLSTPRRRCEMSASLRSQQEIDLVGALS
jgi:hypothetical protein